GGKRKFGTGLEVMNAMEIAQLPIITAGEVFGLERDCETIRLRGVESYRKFVIRDDKLIGALFVGDIERAGVYIALLKSAIPLGALKQKIREGILHYGHFEHHHRS
ncbi:MAG: hypothetical protein OEV64_12905, partial [Desulfobulbaceae bacterium]|nr:hypothetical protein [Desulfobulbaceae bacterium]